MLIGYQLSRIGWLEVWHNLPVHPGFYLLALVLYFTLPVTEITIYRRLWGIPAIAMLRTSLVKRVFNEEVIGYSGEVYLFTRARQYTQRSQRQLMRDIRDVSILSAVTSNIVAIALLGLLLAWGLLPAGVFAGELPLAGILAGAFLAVLLALMLMRYRRHWFALPGKEAMRIFALYALRFSVHHVLLVTQWHLVMPETPWTVWLMYVTLTIVLNRIPLLPGKDLIFLWAGIALSGHLELARDSVAGMLLVSSTLTRLANLVVYWLNRQDIAASPPSNG